MFVSDFLNHISLVHVCIAELYVYVKDFSQNISLPLATVGKHGLIRRCNFLKDISNIAVLADHIHNFGVPSPQAYILELSQVVIDALVLDKNG